MNASVRTHIVNATRHLAFATEELRKARLESDSEREQTDMAVAMFHMGSAYGVLHDPKTKKPKK